MGWVIASIVAAYVFSRYMQSKIAGPPKPAVVPGPTASEGVPIPVVLGTRTVSALNCNWFGDQKAGIGTIVQGSAQFQIAMQLGICHGAIDDVLDIRYSNKVCNIQRVGGAQNGWTWFSLNTVPILAPNPLQWDVKATGAWSDGRVNADEAVDAGTTNYLSTLMGMPSSTGLSPISAPGDQIIGQGKLIAGASCGPKYFGVAQLVILTYLLTGNLAPYEVTVKRIHKINGGKNTQWHDEIAEIASTSRSRRDLWKYKVQAVTDYTDYSGATYDDSTWPEAYGGIGNAPVGYDLANEYGDKYGIPVTGFQLPSDGTMLYGKYPNQSVVPGTKLWLRWTFGPLPRYPFNVQCWMDDTAELWFNGTAVEIVPTPNAAFPPAYNEKYSEWSRHNGMAVIPKELINASGPNVIAYKVMRSMGVNKYIYAGLQFGQDDNAPAGVGDLNPAHLIREVLTDQIWSPEPYDVSELDDASFYAAAQTLYNEGLGLSFTWTEQMNLEDFLNDILRHISGVLYEDRTTGLLVLKLIRDDYTVGDLPVLDESNVVKVENDDRKQPGELVSKITVTYSATTRGDRGSVTIVDDGLANVQGVVAETIDYPACTSQVNAAKLMLRDLRILSSPLLTCQVTANRAAAGLYIGDPFVLNWPDLGITNFVMRVNEIDVGDSNNGEVKISCMEDIFFFPKEPFVVGNGPVSLLPPPTVSLGYGYDAFTTDEVIDQRNKGQCEFVFASFPTDPDSPWSDNSGTHGWTETAPGVMVCNNAGPLSSGQCDGIDPFNGFAGGGPYQSWLIGKRVLVAKTLATYFHQELVGPFIVDDPGGYWDDAGTFHATYAQMHRDPAFNQSPNFTKGMVFQIMQGTTYGGHWLQLATAGVVLGSTPQEWTDAGTSFTFVNTFELLRSDQVASRPVSADSSIEVTTTAIANAHDFQGFGTLPNTFQSGYIPDGTWKFQFPPVYITGQSAGSTTTIGLKAYSTRGSGSVLFEIQSEAITWDSFQRPADVSYAGSQYQIDANEDIALIYTIHTDSTTLVTMHAQCNGDNAARVLIPSSSVSGNIVSSPEEAFFKVTPDANGVVSGIGSARNLLFVGSSFKGLDATGLAGGTTVHVSFKQAATIHGNASPATGVPIYTWQNDGGPWQDVSASAGDSGKLKLHTELGTQSYWQYLPEGGSGASGVSREDKVTGTIVGGCVRLPRDGGGAIIGSGQPKLIRIASLTTALLGIDKGTYADGQDVDIQIMGGTAPQTVTHAATVGSDYANLWMHSQGGLGTKRGEVLGNFPAVLHFRRVNDGAGHDYFMQTGVTSS